MSSTEHARSLPLFASAQYQPPASAAPKVSAPQVAKPQPAPADEDPIISFSIQLRRSTYIQLKQAEYWTPGFGLMRDQVDVAIRTHLAGLPGSTQPLPPKELEKLLNSKKMQAKPAQSTDSE